MFNLDKFIADNVTFRPVSMFLKDIELNRETLTREIKDKKVLHSLTKDFSVCLKCDTNKFAPRFINPLRFNQNN